MKRTFTLLLLFAINIPHNLLSQEAAVVDPLKEQETELRQKWSLLQDTGNFADSDLGQLSSEDQTIIQNEEEERVLNGLEVIYGLSQNLAKQEEAGNDTNALRAFVVERISEVPKLLFRAIDRRQEELKSLRDKKSGLEAGELGILEEQIGTAEGVVNDFYEMAVSYIFETKRLNIPDTDSRKKILDLLQFRARLLAGRLKMETIERNILRKRVSANPDDADLVLKLDAVYVASNTSISSLEVAVGLLEDLELDVTSYKSILIQATGDISKGIEFAIIKQFLQSGWQAVLQWFQEKLPSLMTRLLVFLLIFYFFHLIGILVRKAISRTVRSDRINVSRLLGTMIASTSYKFILILGILVALMQVGISLTPVLAGLGVAGFIVGFALQETLGNFASGIMILFYRPFDEGDFIEAAGVKGSVNKMSLVSTTILTIDNQTLIIPNSKIWGDVICNRSEQETRRVDLVFGVSYSAEIPHVEQIIEDVLAGCDLILPDPKPVVRVHELADSSVNFVVRPWVKNSDYWDTYWYMMREMKIRFDEAGIGIPFPQRDVHHYHPESTDK